MGNFLVCCDIYPLFGKGKRVLSLISSQPKRTTCRAWWHVSLGVWEHKYDGLNGIPLQYLAWKIPWMEEPGGLQSMGSLRVGHDWTTSLSLFTFMHWRRKWQPTPVFLPGESQGRGSLVAAVYGVTQSRTRLKWLSSGSSGNYTSSTLCNKKKVC